MLAEVQGVPDLLIIYLCLTPSKMAAHFEAHILAPILGQCIAMANLVVGCWVCVQSLCKNAFDQLEMTFL